MLTNINTKMTIRRREESNTELYTNRDRPLFHWNDETNPDGVVRHFDSFEANIILYMLKYYDMIVSNVFQNAFL